MKPIPHFLFQAPSLLYILVLTLALPTTLVHGAFTVPGLTSKNDTSTVSPNDAGTWCFYPAPQDERTVLPSAGDCTGPAESDFRAVLHAHLDQTASISYYSADLQRLGGAEYVVGDSASKIYLCMSGRAVDGLYETTCEDAERDNMFGRGEWGNRTVCSVDRAQGTVSDACYAPGLEMEAEGNGAVGVLLSSCRSALWLIPIGIYTIAAHLL